MSPAAVSFHSYSPKRAGKAEDNSSTSLMSQSFYRTDLFHLLQNVAFLRHLFRHFTDLHMDQNVRFLPTVYLFPVSLTKRRSFKHQSSACQKRMFFCWRWNWSWRFSEFVLHFSSAISSTLFTSLYFQSSLGEVFGGEIWFTTVPGGIVGNNLAFLFRWFRAGLPFETLVF